MVQKAWSPYGFIRFEVYQYGENEPWICQGITYWEKMDQPEKAVAMDLAKPLFEDIANFTDITPVRTVGIKL